MAKVKQSPRQEAKKAITIKKSKSVVEVKSSDKEKAQSGGGHAIEPAKGKLGIMIPGMGAVATTFVAGVEAVRKGIAQPIGSLTQMGTIRLGQAHRWPVSQNQGVRSARRAQRSGLHRLGHF